MVALIKLYLYIADARRRWGMMADTEREQVMHHVAEFRNGCLRTASDRGFPWVDLSSGYVVSQNGWELFTSQAKIEVLMEAMMELDDPKSAKVRRSSVVLLEWPDPTVGMFDEIGASDE